MHQVSTDVILVLKLIWFTGWRIGLWPCAAVIAILENRKKAQIMFYDAREVVRALGWGPTLNPSHDVVSAVESQKPARERVAA
jgi:hypothetical protein